MIGTKNAVTNIFRIQAYDSIMCGQFNTGFTNFIFKRKTLSNFRNLFLPHDLVMNDEVIIKYYLEQNINISGRHFSNTKGTFLESDKSLQFRVPKIKEKEDFLLLKSTTEKDEQENQ